MGFCLRKPFCEARTSYNNMYVTLRGVEKIRSLGFKQRSVSWDSFGVVGQISRSSFICPPMPATSHTPTLWASPWTVNN